MNDRQLRYALTVRDELSFSRAAERLLVAQPSVSEQVRLLEADLGFPLFRRTGRGVEVTEQGRVFLRQADQVITGLLGLTDLARQLQRRPLSGFAIGLSTGIAQFLVPLVTRAIQQNLAGMQLSVVTATTPRINRLIAQEALHAGVTVQIGPRNRHPSLRFEMISGIEMALFVPPNHRLARAGRIHDLADIVAEPLIINEPDAGYGALVQSLFTSRGLSPNVIAVADHVDTIKMMIISHVGVAILPIVSALAELRLGQLVRVSLEPRCVVELSLVRQARTLDSPIETCIQRVREALRQHERQFRYQTGTRERVLPRVSHPPQATRSPARRAARTTPPSRVKKVTGK